MSNRPEMYNNTVTTIPICSTDRQACVFDSTNIPPIIPGFPFVVNVVSQKWHCPLLSIWFISGIFQRQCFWSSVTYSHFGYTVLLFRMTHTRREGGGGKPVNAHNSSSDCIMAGTQLADNFPALEVLVVNGLSERIPPPHCLSISCLYEGLVMDVDSHRGNNLSRIDPHLAVRYLFRGMGKAAVVPQLKAIRLLVPVDGQLLIDVLRAYPNTMRWMDAEEMFPVNRVDDYEFRATPMLHHLSFKVGGSPEYGMTYLGQILPFIVQACKK